MKKRIGAIILVAAMLLAIFAVPAGAVSIQDFTDVEEGSWYYDYVDTVVKEGYFVGTSDTTFEPAENMTRAMFVVVLARVEHATVNNDAAAFTDVPAGQWYSGAVAWAAANNIVTGYADGTFKPDSFVTRQEMAVMMTRLVNYHETQNKATHIRVANPVEFTDEAEIGQWAKEAVDHCSDLGLIIGFEDGSYRPAENSTRAQVAAVITRLHYTLNPAEEAPKPIRGGGGGGFTPEPEPDDLILAAVKSTMEDVNGYIATANGYSDNYEGTYEYALDIEDITIEEHDKDEGVANVLTAAASAELTPNFAKKVITVAGSLAAALLDGDSAPVEEKYDAVKEIVVAVADKLGVDLDTKSAEDLVDQLYDKFHEKTYPMWTDYFKDEEGFLFKTMTVYDVDGTTVLATVRTGNDYQGPTTCDGGWKFAAKNIALAIASQVLDELKAINAPTTSVELTGTLKVKFDGIAERTEISNPDYELVGTLNLESNGLVSYYYDGGAFLTINLEKDDIEELTTTVAEPIIKQARQKIVDYLVTNEGMSENVAVNTMYGNITGYGDDLDALIAYAEGKMDINSVAAEYNINLDAHPALKKYGVGLLVDAIRAEALEAGFSESLAGPLNLAEGEFDALFDDFIDTKFGSLAKILISTGAQSKLADKFGTQVQALVSYLDYIPDTASIKIGGHVLDNSDLAELRGATSASSLATAIANLMKTAGFKDLTPEDFMNGVKITVSDAEQTHSFTLIINVE